MIFKIELSLRSAGPELPVTEFKFQVTSIRRLSRLSVYRQPETTLHDFHPLNLIHDLNDLLTRSYSNITPK